MVVIYNEEKCEDIRIRTWSKALTQRAKEVVLDCLEAGLDAYEENGDAEGVAVLNELIDLFNKEE